MRINIASTLLNILSKLFDFLLEVGRRVAIASVPLLFMSLVMGITGLYIWYFNKSESYIIIGIAVVLWIVAVISCIINILDCLFHLKEPGEDYFFPQVLVWCYEETVGRLLESLSDCIVLEEVPEPIKAFEAVVVPKQIENTVKDYANSPPKPYNWNLEEEESSVFMGGGHG